MGVARNLLRGTKEWSGAVPQRDSGTEPRWEPGDPAGVWGRSPQKPETHAEYSTEQNTQQEIF